VLTVIETEKFQKLAAVLWTEDERMAFIDWIAANPGDVVPGTQGARKVRWQAGGRGKRGGVRVVYFHLPVDGVVLLVLVYAKSQRQNVQPKDIVSRPTRARGLKQE